MFAQNFVNLEHETRATFTEAPIKNAPRAEVYFKVLTEFCRDSSTYKESFNASQQQSILSSC